MNQTAKKIIIAAIIIVVGLALYNTFKQTGTKQVSLPPSASLYSGSLTEEAAPATNLGIDKSTGRAIGIPPLQPDGTADFEDVTREDRLIIRDAQFSLVSENVQASVDQLTNHATSAGGFITNVNVSNLERAPYATVSFRVPVERFEETRSLVRSLGIKTVSEQVTGQDVTEQYVDTEARLKNLRASEEQFAAIMKQAVKVEEVLAVQQQLERVRGQIEQAQGRMQYLTRSAKLATFNVTISADEEDLPLIDPVERWRPLAIAKAALRSLIKAFQSLGTKLIWIIIFIPIWLPVIIIAYLIYRRLNKKTTLQ